ncbi:hypothetical protein [Methylobacterium sp. ID0610]|uniref:hypothetical protein n=1 Tax=Methylobacterium carpenticola TaxID=3344827 RepID=UPI0036A64571
MTAEQIRLMTFLDLVGGWVTLFELSGTRALAKDDDLFVPSLVARGWADHDPDGAAIRISTTGREVLDNRLDDPEGH